MKKTISLILAVIMLLSAVPMQSFALFDLKPIVVKVEALDDVPISNRYMQYLKEDYFTFGAIPDYCNFKFKVYFSNGKSVITDNYFYDGSDEESGIANTYVIFQLQPAYAALTSALGKDTIKVRTHVFVEYTDGTAKSYMFFVEKPFTEGIVDEVNYLGEMPEITDEYYPEHDFVGEKFTVKYSDGRNEILTLEEVGDDYFYLGDKLIYMWCEEDTYVDEKNGKLVYCKNVYCQYLDEISVVCQKEYYGTYKDFKIVDYKFTDDGGLKELTYEINYNDGQVVKDTHIFDNPVYEGDDTAYICLEDGEYIDVYVSAYEDKLHLSASINYNGWIFSDYIDLDIDEFCDCRCHKDGFLNTVVNAIISKIWQIFNINEYCQCGCWHW